MEMDIANIFVGLVVIVVLVVTILVTYGSVYQTEGTPPVYARQFGLGATTLGAVFLLFLLAMVMYFFKPDGTAKTIWDTAVQVFPPIITLILGFFFGRTTSEQGKNGDSE